MIARFDIMRLFAVSDFCMLERDCAHRSAHLACDDLEFKVGPHLHARFAIREIKLKRDSRTDTAD